MKFNFGKIKEVAGKVDTGKVLQGASIIIGLVGMAVDSKVQQKNLAKAVEDYHNNLNK